MELTRRRLLSVGGTTGLAALAGCSGGCVRGLPFVGSGMPNDGEVATDPVDAVPEDATTIDLATLPDPERSLLRTAVEDGVARVCTTDGGDRADALRSFADRVSPESSYLAAGGDHYGLWVRIEDMVFAGTADPPEGDGNPCC
ncbi:MAG: hypothetical protein ABEJ28_04200 [Salinigranum sp.]